MNFQNTKGKMHNKFYVEICLKQYKELKYNEFLYGFLPVAYYPKPDEALLNEVGRISNVFFILKTNKEDFSFEEI